MKSNHNLIWIDLEMSGLDPKKERIIELATVVTDSHLVILAEGPVLAIHQSDTCLAGMDAWNTRQHHQSGLVERVKASHIDEQEAERQTITFLQQWTDKGKSPMCGNSIYQDMLILTIHILSSIHTQQWFLNNTTLMREQETLFYTPYISKS